MRKLINVRKTLVKKTKQYPWSKIAGILQVLLFGNLIVPCCKKNLRSMKYMTHEKGIIHYAFSQH